MIDIEAESIADGDKRASSAGVTHRRVTFIRVIMQPSTLEEAKSNAAYLVFLDSAIRFELDAQDELGRNGLDTSWDLAHLIHALVDGSLMPQSGMLGATPLIVAE